MLAGSLSERGSQIHEARRRKRGYNHPVYRLFAILTALAVTALPLQGSLMSGSDCSGCSRVPCVHSTDDAGVSAESSCCGNGSKEQQSPGRDHWNSPPCDEDNCQLSCCGVANTLATHSRSAGKTFVFQLVMSTVPTREVSLPSPHLSKLRRPPRPVTSA